MGLGLLATVAVGGITAGLVAERVIGWLGPATTMRLGLIIETSTHLTLALARSPLLVGAVFALFGFHAMTWSVISVSLRQELIPARLLGRVNSAYALFGLGSLSLGAIAGGVLAEWDWRSVFWVRSGRSWTWRNAFVRSVARPRSEMVNSRLVMR